MWFLSLSVEPRNITGLQILSALSSEAVVTDDKSWSPTAVGGIQVPQPRHGTYFVQMIPSEECTSGSLFNRFSARFSFWRFISPQGITEGREVKQLAERSSSVIWWEMSINHSRSTQGSPRFDQFTERAWMWKKGEGFNGNHQWLWLKSIKCWISGMRPGHSAAWLS